ncbi:DUF305 domain-containing protein [Saccharopolyspora sp. ID03-671]
MGNMAPSTAAPAPGTAQQGDHNQADITFTQQMIPHHVGALDMAKMVQGRTSNPQVLDLAGRIEQAQDPEIKQMTGWLQAWGAQTPPTGMPGMDHGSMPGMESGAPMPGMMSQDEMNQLMAAKDGEFDKLFLEMMIKHHQGAVDMAKVELSQGSNAEAKALAQRIIDSQQAEIDEMHKLLQG